MKKILAVLLVFSMMFALVACSGKDEDPITDVNVENTTDDQAVNAGDVDVEPSTDENASEEDSTEETSTEKDEEQSTGKNDEGTTAKPAPSDNPAEWSKSEIVDFYKKAATKSHASATSSQKMVLHKLEVNEGDGLLSGFVKMIKPIVDTVIKNNETTYGGITGGYTNLVPSDVKTAKAYKQGKYTIIEMTMVEQTDGLYGDFQGGTVGHAINVLGNVATAVEQFPAFDINYKDADIKIKYTKPTVKVKINENGIIEKGTWNYYSKIDIKNLEIENVNITIRKAYAEIEYIIVVGGGF